MRPFVEIIWKAGGSQTSNWEGWRRGGWSAGCGCGPDAPQGGSAMKRLHGRPGPAPACAPRCILGNEAVDGQPVCPIAFPVSPSGDPILATRT